MPNDTPPAPGDELQFDRVVAVGGAMQRNEATCESCRSTLADEYYHVNGRSVCDSCLTAVEQHAAVPTGPGPLMRATLLGIGAAIAGAALYYAVLALTGFEIGLVAIVIGYMVGWSVRRGAGDRGGRRFQIVAALLTYWSVGLAYVPLTLGRVPEATPHTIGVALLLALALPVQSVIRTFPGGLLSGAIIVFGIMQAWRMTAAPRIVTSGPYRIGTAAPTVAP